MSFAGSLARARRVAPIRPLAMLLALDAAYRGRRMLAQLPPERLADIGVSDAQRHAASQWPAPRWMTRPR